MRNFIFYKRSSLFKVLLASTVACLSTQPTFAKNDAKVSAPLTSQSVNMQNAQALRTVSGVVKDEAGEPLIGVSVTLKGTSKGTVTDVEGRYTIKTDVAKPALVFSYVGYVSQTITVADRTNVDVVLKEENTMLTGVVVTAMGIRRKEKSLTYATQQVKADDLTKVQDPNVANNLEGKVSGITITPSAGGAGGASKILLRGNKSILGNNAAMIVVDGIPVTNETRGQRGMGGDGFEYSGMAEGSDALSMLNPDDIESINVLKGANAAALYGSRAANGVLMITTKKGREGKVSVNFSSNVTFDTPLLTPKIQNVYGAAVDGAGFLSPTSWGGKVADRPDNQLLLDVPLGDQFLDPTHKVHLRNRAVDDVKDFFRTGVTANNSISVSGGTNLVRTYFSAANSHANGMIRKNSYNRNALAFRQSYHLFERLNVDVSLNYTETVTRNRPGGGTVGNPIYHLYMMPRNIDLGYYRNNYVTQGRWNSNPHSYYKERDQASGGGFIYQSGQRATLKGPLQEWAYLSNANNNPYWLTDMNGSKQKEDRLFGTVSANVDIYDGLSFQARLNYTKTHYNNYRDEYATTFLPSSMSDYGRMWDSHSTTTELYTDYLLNYNKEFGDYSVSASAGWVGHTVKGTTKATSIGEATYIDPLLRKLSTVVNYFETNAGDRGATATSHSSTWDKAYLITAQLGWKETVYIDGSYRRDWYRPYRQFYNYKMIPQDNFGYFSVGGNAIVSNLVKLPTWFNYLKYRLSYSDVGNSIPNLSYFASSFNHQTGAGSANTYNAFSPTPETLTSIETGIETLFLNNRLSFDFTYYNNKTKGLYMEYTDASGKRTPTNAASVRNQGFETTIGYDFRLGKDLRWRTSYNLSYNDNKVLKTFRDANGRQQPYQQQVAGAYVIAQVGGSIGDIYVNDFDRDANGHIKLTSAGRPRFKNTGDVSKLRYVGNMNSQWQMGWSNTFSYKDFTLSFLINGRLGGKVISLTEAYLDLNGLSQRTADARLAAEKNGIVATNYGNRPGMVLGDGSGRIVPIEEYYKAMGGSSNPYDYIYNATNFRLRELSLGYTFRDLFGMNKNLSVSFIARNLFFIYKDSPVDPDVSLSTTNGLNGFELFNMPSSRSYGLSLKVNF